LHTAGLVLTVFHSVTGTSFPFSFSTMAICIISMTSFTIPRVMTDDQLIIPGELPISAAVEL
jgi:hypothetical protein